MYHCVLFFFEKGFSFYYLLGTYILQVILNIFEHNIFV